MASKRREFVCVFLLLYIYRLYFFLTLIKVITIDGYDNHDVDNHVYDSMVFSRQVTRPSLTSSSNAQSISKQRLSTKLEEMNERFEAIEEITRNMNREFQSSKVVINQSFLNHFIPPLLLIPHLPR